MKQVRAKRALTDKEFDELLTIENPIKRKKFFEKIQEELFEEYEYNKTKRREHE